MNNRYKQFFAAPAAALVGVAAFLPIFLALASPPRLSVFFANRSAVISSRFGSMFLNFGSHGTVRGSSVAVLALGQKSTNDSGRWWVQASFVCIRWSSWFDGRPRCFEVHFLDQAAFQWRSEDGEAGDGRLLDQGAKQ
jgi:hypothetical protein